MTKSKHTPGPWNAVPANPEDRTVVEAGKNTWCIDGSGCHFEDYANAKLIAAAPEMLAWLKFLLDAWELDPDQRENISSLIAKAEGRE